MERMNLIVKSTIPKGWKYCLRKTGISKTR